MLTRNMAPETVFLLAIEKLQPHVKSIFYGEACSSRASIQEEKWVKNSDKKVELSF